MFLRSCAIAIAAVMLCAGASTSHAGSYDRHIRYPKDAFGKDAYFERHHPAARAVTCDRARDVCFDRYGLSYHATMRFLGERKANRSYKRYGEQVFLFSPARGVICDRRMDRCSFQRWGQYGHSDRAHQPWRRDDGTAHSGWQYPTEQQPGWRWRRD